MPSSPPRTTKPQQPTHTDGEAPPPLPHERDESTDARVAIKPKTAQAARDLAAGQVDTDNYTRTLSNNRRNSS